MSIANTEDSDGLPTGRGEPPAPGAWARRQAKNRAEAEAERERKHQVVLSRLRYDRGRGLADLTESCVRGLGVGWRAGTGQVVRELLELGRVVERDGQLFRVDARNPGAAAGQEPPAGEREDGPAAAQRDSAAPSVGLEQQPSADLDGDPAAQPDRDGDRSAGGALDPAAVSDGDTAPADRTDSPAPVAHSPATPSDDARLTGPHEDGSESGDRPCSGEGTEDREAVLASGRPVETGVARVESGAPSVDGSDAGAPAGVEPRPDPSPAGQAGVVPADEDPEARSSAAPGVATDAGVETPGAPSDRPESGPEVRAWRLRHDLSQVRFAALIRPHGLEDRSLESIQASLSTYERGIEKGSRELRAALDLYFDALSQARAEPLIRQPSAGAVDLVEPSHEGPVLADSVAVPEVHHVTSQEVPEPAGCVSQPAGEATAVGDVRPPSGSPGGPGVPSALEPVAPAAEPGTGGGEETLDSSPPGVSSPPPVAGAFYPASGGREGGDPFFDPASSAPHHSRREAGSLEGDPADFIVEPDEELDEHLVPSDLLDEFVDLRLRLEVVQRASDGYRARSLELGEQLELAARQRDEERERADAAERALAERDRDLEVVDRVLDRARCLGVPESGVERRVRSGALWGVIERLAQRVEGGVR